MTCPGCRSTFQQVAPPAHGGATVEIDLCVGCQVLWFDRLESVRLSPAGTLQLFRLFGERPQLAPARLAEPLPCPRCGLRLRLTHDRQRNTRFRYWRCARQHGRLITFFEFLREKDFIRPLSPAQLEALRAGVQALNCSNCGASIDLEREAACAHCGTAISMLDLPQVQRMVETLQRAGAGPPATDPTLPLQLDREKRQVEALFESLRAGPAGRPDSFGLVEIGLRLLSGRIGR